MQMRFKGNKTSRILIQKDIILLTTNSTDNNLLIIPFLLKCFSCLFKCLKKSYLKKNINPSSLFKVFQLEIMGSFFDFDFDFAGLSSYLRSTMRWLIFHSARRSESSRE